MNDPNHNQPPGFGGGGNRRRRRRGRRGRGSGDGGVAVARPQGGGGGGSNFQRPGRLADAPVPAGEASAEVTGVLQQAPEGHGFLRSAANDFNADANDPWIPREIVQSLGLETGVEVQ